MHEQLLVMLKELGTGIILSLFQIGLMPEVALKSMTLFATAVMPQVRAEVGATTDLSRYMQVEKAV